MRVKNYNEKIAAQGGAKTGNNQPGKTSNPSEGKKK